MLLIGLRYLEVNDVMHRDLKPDNILIDVLPNGFKILLITDFGLSKNEKIH
jgi:serine/threonine protein kinase